jgi:hypothetical protein
MSSVYFNLSTITENTVVKNNEAIYKGSPSLQFVLTGIDESFNKALSLELNWGDSTPTEYYSKDIIFNYRDQSIFNELLYNKPGGTICFTYNHRYDPPITATVVTLTAQMVVYFSTGVYARFFQPIKLVKESYYDSVKEFSILNTQIATISSNTIANLESKDNRTFIAILN